jgi:hypothetical protein
MAQIEEDLLEEATAIKDISVHLIPLGITVNKYLAGALDCAGRRTYCYSRWERGSFCCSQTLSRRGLSSDRVDLHTWYNERRSLPLGLEVFNVN